jgi:hypothetical protein
MKRPRTPYIRTNQQLLQQKRRKFYLPCVGTRFGYQRQGSITIILTIIGLIMLPTNALKFILPFPPSADPQSYTICQTFPLTSFGSFYGLLVLLRRSLQQRIPLPKQRIHLHNPIPHPRSRPPPTVQSPFHSTVAKQLLA